MFGLLLSSTIQHLEDTVWKEQENAEIPVHQPIHSAVIGQKNWAIPKSGGLGGTLQARCLCKFSFPELSICLYTSQYSQRDTVGGLNMRT